MIDESILKKDELAVFALRKLYSTHGYKKYKMRKFEEYDFYSENKDFLASEGIITFTDADGRLLALKPDVTLSILKNFKEKKGCVKRLYYNENVYRISETSHTYQEIMQTGLECMGDIGSAETCEVALLALQSLALISEDYVLDLAHAGLLFALLDAYGLQGEARKRAERALSEKNADALRAACTDAQFAILANLIRSGSDNADTLRTIKKICRDADAEAAFAELAALYAALEEAGYAQHIRIDFSVVDAAAYYSGAVFCGYIKGVESRVLAGGRYDRLMRKMGSEAGAIGFAVYLDALERFEEKQERVDTLINIALPKGRLGERVYEMFEQAGFACPSIREANRKLVFENPQKGVRYFWVKPSDVAIYVERGAADIGVAGKDILLEYEPHVYELLDLNVGKCRMAVAAQKDFNDDTSTTLRVATKFTNIARKFYAEKCRDIDIIHLNGSIELAPILGLSDVIVDIVETGKTLLENNLEPVETVVPISARLIANKSALKFKTEQIEAIRKGLMKGLAEQND